MKRIIYVLCILVTLTSLISCAPTTPAVEEVVEVQPTPTPKLRPQLIIATVSEPDILDVQQGWNSWSEITEQMCQPLVRFDETKANLVPDLAASWEISEDGKIVTWKLPADYTFANGDPLDAQAVADAWWRYKTISPYAEDLAPMLETNVIDATTLEVVHDNPPAFMWAVLVGCFGAPWDVAEAGKVGDEAFLKNPVASGPFKLKEWVEGSYILMERNENYRTNLSFVENKGPAHLQEVMVRFIPEDLTRASELEAGTVDVVFGLPASSVQSFKDNPDIEVLSASEAGYRGVVVNMLREPYNDVHVRAAIASALDREAFVNVLEGTVVPQYAVIAPAMVGYSEKMQQYAKDLYPYDPQAARDLLAEAGWTDSNADGIVDKDGEPFSMVFLVPSDNPAFVKVAPVIQEQLKVVGIDVSLEQYTASTIFDMQVAGDYDMSIGGYGWTDADILIYVFTDEGWNRAHYQNEQLLSMLQEARYIMDIAERTAKYEEIQKIVIDDVVEIPLWSNITYVGVRTWVKGLKIDASLNLYLNDVTVVEE